MTALPTAEEAWALGEPEREKQRKHAEKQVADRNEKCRQRIAGAAKLGLYQVCFDYGEGPTEALQRELIQKGYDVSKNTEQTIVIWLPKDPE